MPTTVILHTCLSCTAGPSRGAGSFLPPWPRVVIVLVTLLLLPGIVGAQSLPWPEAVAALAAERTQAETCVRLLKRYASNNPDALSRGELAFTTAKAEVDAVIAGLLVVLAQGGTPPSLADVEVRLTRGVEGRETFCRQVVALMPEDAGTKSPLVQLVGAFVEPLLQAVGDLWKFQKEFSREQDRLLRQTIQTQLEATQWAAFAAIHP